jgi:hypothetical protein
MESLKRREAFSKFLETKIGSCMMICPRLKHRYKDEWATERETLSIFLGCEQDSILCDCYVPNRNWDSMLIVTLFVNGKIFRAQITEDDVIFYQP